MISLPVIHREVDEGERRFALTPVTGKFVNGELEQEFGEKWHQDMQRRSAGIALVGGLLLLIPGLAIDVWSEGLSVRGSILMLIRVATVMPLVAYGWVTRPLRRTIDETFDHLLPVLLQALMLAGFIAILTLRSSPLPAETATFCVIVLAVHLMAPNRVVLVAPVTALACIAFELVRLTMTQGGGVDHAIELGVVAVTYGCGVFFNRDLELIRREEFVALTIATEYSDRLARALQRASDLENEMRSQANRDPLTGLANRRWLFGEFEREFARARRTRRPLSVMILDADHFKNINDTYGHDCGDKVLCALASVLSQTVRATDALARIGGEEFAVLMPETDAVAARELAERIRSGVAATRVSSADQSVHVTISCGVTACLVDTEQPGEALKRADAGLYEAKHRGRDLVITR